MSLQVILKNVYNFVEILQTACGESVNSWDVESLNNALKWANYCKQIHVQGKGKSYESELNQHIVEIGKLPWAIGEREINLEELKNADDLLKQALLQNPHLPESVYERLLLTYGNLKTFPESLFQDIRVLKSDHQSAEVISCCIAEFKPDDNEDQKQHRDDSAARLLLQYSHKLLTQKASRQERCKEILSEKLQLLAKDENGLVIVCKACSLPCIEEIRAQEFILNWLLSEAHHVHVLELNADVLAEVSNAHFTFYQSYMKYLYNSSKNLHCEVDKNGLVLYKLQGKMSYDSLQTRIRALIQCGEHLSSATYENITSYISQDTTGFWRHLLLAIKHSID